ncbi:MAG TPA: MlaD family protein [Chthoniobacteraceae bacterium]|nr:MlaD family protein [Chthoniobacteraceae bacterium]
MKKNLSDYVVAIVVIVCSLVLLGALTVALSGFRLKKPTRTVQIDYRDVTGIHLASELRYAGAPAGHVIGIRLLTAQEREGDEKLNLKERSGNAVRITVEVNADVPPIPDDAQASINSDTLLSEKFIAISAGSPVGSDDVTGRKVEELANNAVLQGEPGGLDALLSGNGINGVLADVQTNLLPKLGIVLDSAHKTVGDVDTVVNNANTLINDKSSLHATLDLARDAVAKLQGVESDLDGVLNKTGGVVTNLGQSVDGRMKELSVVMENLKVATTYLKSFSKQLAEKPNRVIFTTKTEKQPAEEEILKNPKPVPAP